MLTHSIQSASNTDIYKNRLLMNQNKSGKLKTSKTHQKEPILSTTDIYVRRLLKGQEPIFRFALGNDQLLICFHDKQSTYIDLWLVLIRRYQMNNLKSNMDK